MKKMENDRANSGKLFSSFRDPSGFIFYNKGTLLRQINLSYKDDFDLFLSSGLYQALLKDEFIIAHEEVAEGVAMRDEGGYKIIKPELVPFISYPCEWSFSQLKDAALLTLKIQKRALDFNMFLKDASAYNIQFKNGKPVLIDTLSFEKYKEGEPWIAYKQFCQHFLAPLALMSYRDVRLGQLFRIYIDGIPLDLASSLLPLKTRFVLPLLSHIHLHAKTQKYFSDKIVKNRFFLSYQRMLALIDNIEHAVKGLKWEAKNTEWADYYDKTNYSVRGFENKKETISKFIDIIKPRTVWDIGANNGLFSRIASENEIFTVSLDIDPAAVEQNYLLSLAKKDKLLLPLVVDLFNPTPSMGWGHRERMSFVERGPADVVFALALVHHLAISNNLPLSVIAEFLSRIGDSLIIEFVPKDDSQVKRLLSTRKDIFLNYNKESFEKEFSQYFKIQKIHQIEDSKRVLYLMKKT